MKAIALYFLVLATAMGGGYFLRDRAATDDPSGRDSPPSRKAASAADQWIEKAGKKESTDTITDLVENRTSTRLPRMTLWLLDASTDEILDLWRTLDERDELDMRTYDLILIHWTERDPRGAIAAAGESDIEGPAWWAWGRADPEVAIETALRESPGHASMVLRAIGQFHIDIALQLMEEHPEALSHGSIEGIGAGLRRGDPGQAVEFLRGHGQSSSDAMKKWAEEDPDSALAWARANISGQASSDVDTLVSELVVEHPDRIKGWLDGLPTGGLRQALAEEYVRQLADRDLDAAVAIARAEDGILTKSQLMAALGERLAYRDPGKSLDLLWETLTSQQAALTDPDPTKRFEGKHLLRNWGDQLLVTRPRETLDMTMELSTNGDHGFTYQLMSRWMDRDEVAYAQWLLDQEPGTIRDYGAGTLVDQLTGRHGSNYGRPPDYQSALEWASSIQDEHQRSRHLRNVVSTWTRADPTDARDYFDAAPADDAARAIFESQQKQ